MNLFFTFFYISFSSLALGSSDTDLSKVNWSYEIFDDGGDPGAFNHSVSKGSLSSKSPSSPEVITLPLRNVECLAHAPILHAQSMLLSKAITCREKSSSSFVYGSVVECGKSKRNDVSNSYIQGDFCETSKNCYKKSFRVIFKCSY